MTLSRKEKIKRISSLLYQSEVEEGNFDYLGDWTYLQQACEKIHLAYCFLLEVISKREIRTDKGIEMVTFEMAKTDKRILDLFCIVDTFHSFWYEGEGSARRIKISLSNGRKLFTKLRSSYNIY